MTDAPFSQLAFETRIQRLRGTLGRIIEFTQRCRAILREEVDDDTFTSLLNEATEDLGLRKEQLAAAFRLNQATVYRWLKQKNMPLRVARPYLLRKLADRLKKHGDELVEKALHPHGRRHPCSAPALPNCARLVTPPVPLMRPQGLAVAEMFALEGPFGEWTIGDNSRPSFAAFAWRALGREFQLTPSAAIADACLVVTGPGLSYFSADKNTFVRIEADAMTGRLVFFLAEDPDRPKMNPICLRYDGEGPATGFLLASSYGGVPYDLASVFSDQRGIEDGLRRATVIALNAQETALPKSTVEFSAPFPVCAKATGWDNQMSDLATLEEFANYEHKRAIELKNFRVLALPGLHDLQKSRWNDDRFPYSMVARIVLFEEALGRPSHHGTYLRAHDGGEVIMPLFGAMDAHLFDKEDDHVSAIVNDDNHCSLIALTDASELYAPCILSGGKAGNARDALHRPMILAFDSKRVMHGFTALSPAAALLCLAVKKIKKSADWAARSDLHSHERSIL